MDVQQRKQLGEQIRVRRIEAGYSQAQLAERAAVDEDTLAGAENATRRTHEVTLRRIMDALEIAPPDGDILHIEGVPEDVKVFISALVRRMKVVDEDRRAHMLADLYPRIIE